MARKLETLGIISTSAGFPPKQGTWDFLQQAHQEATKSIIRNLIGDAYDPTVVYRLYGVDITDDGGDNYSNTAGAVFYNDEVYYVPAGGPVFMDNGPWLQIIKTQYTTNADPVTFTDTNIHSVHNIYQMALVNDDTQLPAPIDVNTGWVAGVYNASHTEVGTVTGGGSISAISDVLNRFKIVGSDTAIWNFKTTLTVSGAVSAVQLRNPANMGRNFRTGMSVQVIFDGDPTIAFGAVGTNYITILRYDAGNLGVGAHGLEFKLTEELV